MIRKGDWQNNQTLQLAVECTVVGLTYDAEVMPEVYLLDPK